MLIINADDWASNKSTTDQCLSAYRNDRITSASAKMFKGFQIRRNFSFARGGKSLPNRLYRYLIDSCLIRYYKTTDSFFDIMPIAPSERLKRIIFSAKSSNVELMVHPAQKQEYSYLMREEFLNMISNIAKGTYYKLQDKKGSPSLV